MLIHPKQGLNLHPCVCPRCQRTHQDKMAMGTNNYVDTCPKCKAQYYGGNDHKRCVTKDCGEVYTKNAAYCLSIWQRRELKPNEPVPARTPCQLCVDFIHAVEDAALTGGIGIRCKHCHSEHVIGGDAALSKHAREKLGIAVPNVAYAIVTHCFNCTDEEQQRSLGLIGEAEEEEQRIMHGDTDDLKHFAPHVDEEGAERAAMLKIRNDLRDARRTQGSGVDAPVVEGDNVLPFKPK